MRILAAVLAALALLLLVWIALEEQYQSCVAQANAEGVRVDLRGSGGGVRFSGERGPPQRFAGRIETPQADDCSQLPF